jgi:hypothetical protein
MLTGLVSGIVMSIHWKGLAEMQYRTWKRLGKAVAGKFDGFATW